MRARALRAFARVRVNDGPVVELGSGDQIGRLPSSALCINDARISEAHAMVSLRGSELRLLALRGRFVVDSAPTTSAALVPSLCVGFARDLTLVVEEVVLPSVVLGLRGDGLPLQALSGVSSLTFGPRPSLVPQYVGKAAAWFWSLGPEWWMRLEGEEPRSLSPGTSFVFEGRTFELQAMPLRAASHEQTLPVPGLSPSIRLVLKEDAVQLKLEGEEPLVLSGIQGRILHALASCGGPVAWSKVAQGVWPEGASDQNQLRRKWDISLVRLRQRLKEAGVRPSLVRSDNLGKVELFLWDGDEVQQA